MSSLRLEPIISEKAMAATEAGNVYAFLVPKTAGKIAIAQAVKSRFGVRAVAVNTILVKGKPKQMLVKRGSRRISGARTDFKKAYVKLAKGESIKLFEDKTSKKEKK